MFPLATPATLRRSWARGPSGAAAGLEPSRLVAWSVGHRPLAPMRNRVKISFGRREGPAWANLRALSAAPTAAEPLDDTAALRLAFRRMMRVAVVRAAGLAAVEGVILAAGGHSAGPSVLAAASVAPALVWGFHASRSFPVFFAAVLTFLGGFAAAVVRLALELGPASLVHLVLLTALPLVAVSGRVRTAAKWMLIAAITGLVVFLHHVPRNFAAEPLGDPHASLLATVNIVALALGVSAFAKGFFNLSTRRQHELDRRAARDDLTGLANRRPTEEALRQACASAERFGLPVSVAICDIDNFKAVNDTHGHAAGDAVLRAVGTQLRQSVRQSDHVGRWGGEEFVLVMPGTGAPGAAIVAGQLAESVRNIHVKLEREIVRVTVTVGVATLRPAESPAALLSRADAALYAGKSAGRDRVVASGASTRWASPAEPPRDSDGGCP